MDYRKMIAFTGAISMLLTGCAQAKESVTSINSGNDEYIQFDDNGAYVSTDDSKTYLGVDTQDESSYQTGNVETSGFVFTTDKEWYLDSSNNPIRYLNVNDADGANYMTFGTFTSTDIGSYDKINRDSLSENYKITTDNSGYDSFTFVSDKNIKVCGYDAYEYKCKVTMASTAVDITHCFINDEFGGHIITIADREDDDISMNDEINYIYNNITLYDPNIQGSTSE